MLPERLLGAYDWRLSNYGTARWALLLLGSGVYHFYSSKLAGLARILAWRNPSGQRELNGRVLHQNSLQLVSMLSWRLGAIGGLG